MGKSTISRLPSLPALRHEYQFSGILRTIRSLVVVGINTLDLKSGAGEQVLRLEPERVPHRKLMDETFVAAIRIRHVIDELSLNHLVGVVSRADHMPANNAPAIGGHKLRFLAGFFSQVLVYERFEPRIEEVQNEMPAISQMPVNGS